MVYEALSTSIHSKQKPDRGSSKNNISMTIYLSLPALSAMPRQASNISKSNGLVCDHIRRPLLHLQWQRQISWLRWSSLLSPPLPITVLPRVVREVPLQTSNLAF
jgi:hypothetical protein